jgi:hypothetical protein
METRLKETQRRLNEHTSSFNRQLAEKRSAAAEKNLERLREFVDKSAKKKKSKQGQKKKTRKKEKVVKATVVEEGEDPATDVQVEIIEEDEEESHEAPECKITKHRKRAGEYEVYVCYGGGKEQWEKLYDAWADFEGAVMEYRDSKKNLNKDAKKAFKKPDLEDIEEVKRILGHDGNVNNPDSLTFSILWDNGYVTTNTPYKDAHSDAEQLVEEYVQAIRKGKK